MTNNSSSGSRLKMPSTVVPKKIYASTGASKLATTVSMPKTDGSHVSKNENRSNITSKSGTNTWAPPATADRKRRQEPGLEHEDAKGIPNTLLQTSQQQKHPTPRIASLPESPRPVYSSEIIEAMKKKRPGWDTKGRLEDMEELNQNLIKQMDASLNFSEKIRHELSMNIQRVNQLEKFREELEGSVSKTEDEKVKLDTEKSQLFVQLQDREIFHDKRYNSMKAEYEEKLSHAEMNISNLKHAQQLLQEERTNLRDEIGKLNICLSNKDVSITLLESDKQTQSNTIQRLEQMRSDLQNTLVNTQKELEYALGKISSLENELRTGEVVRKRLHNEVQELKGNIRVFCRVRPLLKQDEESTTVQTSIESNADLNSSCRYVYDSDPWTRTDSIEIIQTMTDPAIFLGSEKPVSKTTAFSFDKVFPPPTTQEQVFDEISQLVQSVLDGYRVCIFAYGQTGSGKTFTMEGPPRSKNGVLLLDDPIAMGMIPRAVLQIFEASQSLTPKGWIFNIEASFLEIYNETLRDLLATPSENESKKLDIRHIPNTVKTVVNDLTTIQVTSSEQVIQLLKKASDNRTIGETQCNERSSRSHSVFMLHVRGENTITSEKHEGHLNLIDLAGSERLSQSGSTGDRLKETQAINKSLSSLGDVIMALANKESHIPYRNSKLTYLLQNSLGGNSKTLMFVNISPASKHVSETICSLRFATKVNACQIGTAKKVMGK
jgi:kinesin family protein C1